MWGRLASHPLTQRKGQRRSRHSWLLRAWGDARHALQGLLLPEFASPAKVVLGREGTPSGSTTREQRGPSGCLRERHVSSSREGLNGLLGGYCLRKTAQGARASRLCVRSTLCLGHLLHRWALRPNSVSPSC